MMSQPAETSIYAEYLLKSKPNAKIAVKTGGRKFQCIDCDGDDPLRSAEVATRSHQEGVSKLIAARF
jgi:hypothetical protein